MKRFFAWRYCEPFGVTSVAITQQLEKYVLYMYNYQVVCIATVTSEKQCWCRPSCIYNLCIRTYAAITLMAITCVQTSLVSFSRRHSAARMGRFIETMKSLTRSHLRTKDSVLLATFCALSPEVLRGCLRQPALICKICKIYVSQKFVCIQKFDIMHGDYRWQTTCLPPVKWQPVEGCRQNYERRKVYA